MHHNDPDFQDSVRRLQDEHSMQAFLHSRKSLAQSVSAIVE